MRGQKVCEDVALEDLAREFWESSIIVTDRERDFPNHYNVQENQE
jgi:hypothetical protein